MPGNLPFCCHPSYTRCAGAPTQRRRRKGCMKKLAIAAALGGLLALGSMLPGVSGIVSTPSARADVSVTPETVDVTLAPGGSTDVTKTLTITPPPGQAGSVDLVVSSACPVSITFSPAPPYSLSVDNHPTQTFTETIAV